jgi:serine/threonine protein kinase
LNYHKYFESIFNAVPFLHFNQIAIRALNFATIFVDTVKSKNEYNSPMISIPNVGFEGNLENVRFSAPEVLLQKQFSFKSEVWSFGCLYFFVNRNNIILMATMNQSKIKFYFKN